MLIDVMQSFVTTFYDDDDDNDDPHVQEMKCFQIFMGFMSLEFIEFDSRYKESKTPISFCPCFIQALTYTIELISVAVNANVHISIY
jgi:hypothetical protein